ESAVAVPSRLTSTLQVLRRADHAGCGAATRGARARPLAERSANFGGGAIQERSTSADAPTTRAAPAASKRRNSVLRVRTVQGSLNSQNPNPLRSPSMSHPAWIEKLFRAIDSCDAAAFTSHLTEDVSFRYGNLPAVQGDANVGAFVQGFFGTLGGLRHEVIEV